jgi:SWI/SNF-related matrix-associated actin-dependent regulator 1 of chromatin subfamily A
MVTKKAIWDADAKLIRVHFPYSGAMVAKLRTLKGAVFARKHWTVKYSEKTVQCLREWGFEMEGTKLHDFSHLPKYPSVNNIRKRLKFDAPYTPEEFQKYGVAFIESRNGNAILADQMRVGKSVQSLLWISECSPKRTLVLCKVTLKETWRREILKWMPRATICVIEGHYYKDSQLPNADFYIINYDIIAVKRRIDGIEKIFFRKDVLRKKPQNLIIDECHYVNSMTAQRTKAVRRLKSIPHIIPLSGTPLDKPVQFFVALNLVAPDLFPSYKDYTERYCDPKTGKDGKKDYSGASNMEELHHILKSTIMLRRTRKEVMPDLAEVKPIIIPLPLSNRNNYVMAEHGTIESLNYAFGDEVWEVNTKSKNILEKLKQTVIAEKLEACIEWIKGTLEQENKLVVFATHIKTIDILRDGLIEYNPVVVDGRTPQKKRQKARDKFTDNDNCHVFIGNTKACKEGLDLSATDVSCTVELDWSPNDHDQSGDRIVHIHKKGAKLLSYFLIAEDTIEEAIMRVLDRKRKVISKLMDGKTVKNEKLLTELLARLKGYNK